MVAGSSRAIIGRYARGVWSAYGWAEIAATACALIAAGLAYWLSGSGLVTALWGDLGENIGFYGIIAARAVHEAWPQHRHHRGLSRIVRVAGAAVWNALIEHGLAEAIDIPLRPALMYVGQALGTGLNGGLTGPVAYVGLGVGLLLGKLAADAVFYSISYACRQWRLKRPRHERPHLLIDLDQVTATFDEFRRALNLATIHYAVKCNPALRLLRHLSWLGSNFEIASAEELRRLRRVRVSPGRIIFSNPTKPVSHITEAYRRGVRWFAADCSDELNKLAEHAPGSYVYIRLRTKAGESEVASEGKFGVGPQRVIKLLLEAKKLGLIPAGISFHVGSQMLDPTAWAKPIRQCGDIMRELRAKHGLTLTMLDLGGGFPAVYDTGHKVPPLEDYGLAILDALNQCLPYQPERLIIEPGRGLVAEAGVLVTPVVTVAEREGVQWVHTLAGVFHGVMEALQTNHGIPLHASDSRGSQDKRRYRLAGVTCDSQDVYHLGAELSADLMVGDLIYLRPGAPYSGEAYATRFNGFHPPFIRYNQRRTGKGAWARRYKRHPARV